MEPDDLTRDLHLSEQRGHLADRPLVDDPQDLHVGQVPGLRVVLGVAPRDERHPSDQVQLVDLVLLALVQVDRTGMDVPVGPRFVDGTEEGSRLLLHDREERS